MSVMAAEKPIATGGYLESDARRVLPRVQSAFAEVLRAVPGRPRRPVDVAKTLDLHGTLAWKVVQVATGRDPLAAAQRLPGGPGIEIFLKAAAKAGAPARAIDEARDAVEAYRTLISAHAGDRPSLELMFNGLSPESRAETEVAYRREGFRCASHIWGVQTRVRSMAYFIHPSRDGRGLDVAGVQGFVSLRRLRPNSPWTLTRAQVTKADNTSAHTELLREPIAPDEVMPGGIPALQRFCSEPLPSIQRILHPNGVAEDRLAPGPIGDAGAITFFSGEVYRTDGQRYRRDPRGYDLYGIQIRTPAQRLVLDLFLPRAIYGATKPELLMFSEMSGIPWPLQDPETTDLLPTTDAIVPIGSGADAAATPDIPRYPELARYVLDRLGWEPEAFDVYRLAMDYPVMGTAPVIRLPLPKVELGMGKRGGARKQRV